jgi:hypothetical protein
MKNWPDDVFERLAGLADDLWSVVDQQAEDLLVDVSQDLEEFVTSFVAFSQDVGTEVQTTLDRTLEQALGQNLEQILSQTFNSPTSPPPDAAGPQPVNLGPLLNQLMSELVQPLGHSWGWDDMPNSIFATPVPARHQVCRGCQHYNGQVYGGNLLVCGMYPYGQPEDAESCPDRELDLRPPSAAILHDFWIL